MSSYTNCVTPEGQFVYGIHKPSYSVVNLREHKSLQSLGELENGENYINHANYPNGDVEVESGGWIFEIPNVLPFRGVTYIDKGWADAAAQNSEKIRLPKQEPLSFSSFVKDNSTEDDSLLRSLPRPLLLSLATCSTDPEDLLQLAELCCELIKADDGSISGMRYTSSAQGPPRPVIHDHDLFEAVANNPLLRDDYKLAMVLRPGAQGVSEITGEWGPSKKSHIFEYLRRNSYISGGHYAANMADDAMRYSISSLSTEDMHGLRHLYYQRIYINVASLLGIVVNQRGTFSADELEELRLDLLETIKNTKPARLATLWGWNFGFDYSPTGYRLHASHQQIHQQYALVPEEIDGFSGDPATPVDKLNSFCCGDLVAKSIEEYRKHHVSGLFSDYLTAMASNKRMDGRNDLPESLVVWQDDNVMVFVPKAQTSQWELQILTLPDAKGRFSGNILETDSECRRSLNLALLKAQQALEGLGAKLVTSIEYSKRIGSDEANEQPLLYALLPKLPYSMGAFSEAQLRSICGHYPEDFASACRNELKKLAGIDNDH